VLDGRRVATRSVDETRVLRQKIAKAGKHRWKVVGYDASGKPVAAGTRSFRVLRAR
jgi:hypothetical protein